MVKINGTYSGHGVSRPTEIRLLLRPLSFCSNPSAPPQYSLAGISNYLDDVAAGSLVLIALQDDLKKFTPPRQKPFLYVHHPITDRKEKKIFGNAKEGDHIKLPCGCTYEVIPLAEYPQDVKLEIIITGHNIDER